MFYRNMFYRSALQMLYKCFTNALQRRLLQLRVLDDVELDTPQLALDAEQTR